jgi:serine protease AprX
MTRTIANSALLLALCAAAAAPGGKTAAQTSRLPNKCDSFLTRRAIGHSRHGWSHVIVRLHEDLTPGRQALLASLGVDTYRHLPIIRSIAVSVPTSNVAKLAALSFVAHLSADLRVKKCDEFLVESSGADTAFAQLGADGTGVGVAVIDSGVAVETDLGPAGDAPPRLLAGANFVPAAAGDDTDRPLAMSDRCGHGTHVAGIVAGNGKSSKSGNCFRTFYGVARNATIVPVRVLDEKGQGVVSQVIAGIQWVVDHRAVGNVRVINLSLGHAVGESYMTDPLCQAVESAWKAGIVVVCSAGNSGRLQNDVDSALDNEGYGSAYGSIQSPGNDPCVITVGAMKATDLVFSAKGKHTHTRSNDQIATYSSRGPSRLDLVLKPDIVAPGNRIISIEASRHSTLYTLAGDTNEVPMADYSKGRNHKASGQYFRLSGTSMAAPVVAGAAALMLQKSPSLSPDTVKARLMLSADKWAQPNGTADPLTFGAGYLNIPAALASTAVTTMPSASPTVSIGADGSISINADRALWGRAFDGTSALWGIGGVTDLRAIWGSNAIAANTSNVLAASASVRLDSVDLERAIWGHSVWEDRAIWGNSSEGVDLSCTALKGE